jgi:hypothetical protein
LHGFVPARTLGLSGPRNADGLLVDAWGIALRYSVSGSDSGSVPGVADFVVAGEMKAVTMAALSPDLTVCNISAGSDATKCASPSATVVGDYVGSSVTPPRGVPAIFYSLGPYGPKWMASVPSQDQVENAGESVVSPPQATGPSGEVYWLQIDNVFVARSRSGDFDDLVEWIPPFVLYARMQAAGQL